MPSFQKISRILASVILGLKFSDQILDASEHDWCLLLTLPNISLLTSLASFLIASYISITEEELGEDGLELDSE